MCFVLTIFSLIFQRILPSIIKYCKAIQVSFFSGSFELLLLVVVVVSQKQAHLLFSVAPVRLLAWLYSWWTRVWRCKSIFVCTKANTSLCSRRCAPHQTDLFTRHDFFFFSWQFLLVGCCWFGWLVRLQLTQNRCNDFNRLAQFVTTILLVLVVIQPIVVPFRETVKWVCCCGPSVIRLLTHAYCDILFLLFFSICHQH